MFTKRTNVSKIAYEFFSLQAYNIMIIIRVKLFVQFSVPTA